MNGKTPLGIIGCGNISSVYHKAHDLYDNLQVVACAHDDMERVRGHEERFGIPKVSTAEEYSAGPESEPSVPSEPKYGTKIPVNTPTHIAGIMEFASGAVGTILTSFDVWHHRLPFIEIYGTEGTLSTPDPNRFAGPVYIRQANDESWREVPLTHGYTVNSRGLGIADMAYAMRTGRLHRANGEMAYHVLDVIESFMQSATEGRHITLTSTCARPEPLHPGVHTWEEDQVE